MNRIETLLQNKADKKPVLMAHFIAGYPTVEESLVVATALVDAGAGIIELQIPFSDPLADGPTIMEASQDALRCGAKVTDALSIARELAARTGVPLAVMSYLNPIFRFGIAEFVGEAKRAGADALIIPDAPFDSEEGQQLYEEANKNGINLILVISPGISRKRLNTLKPYATGFVYCTSRQGITGADSRFIVDLETYIEDARAIFGLPIGLGFGVKTRADFTTAARVADIVIAGSVFVEAVKLGKPIDSNVRNAVRTLLGETHRASDHLD
jgi:tryptophan synthase alpha chain